MAISQAAEEIQRNREILLQLSKQTELQPVSAVLDTLILGPIGLEEAGRLAVDCDIVEDICNTVINQMQ